MNIFKSYTHWLHTRWPAGTVEKMPEVGEDGVTSVPGIRVVGDLTGIPLLKFSADTGAKAIQAIVRESSFKKSSQEELLDVAIIGAGVSGISAALEAKKKGLKFKVFEAAERFNTIVNFPKAKPIYTYPSDMVPEGDLRFTANVKEALLEELIQQADQGGISTEAARIDSLEKKGSEIQIKHAGGEITRAQRVIVAIGRSGNYRRLGVPGQDLDKVYHRLYDPKEYQGKQVLVVGGGDSALESAIALASCGAEVTFSYRKKEFSRPKPENIEKIEALKANPQAQVSIENPVSDRVSTASGDFMPKPSRKGSIRLLMGSKLKEISDAQVLIETAAGDLEPVKNDVVFAMIGREAPLDFFRRSGINIRGEWRAATYASFTAFMAFCFFLYNWKSGGTLTKYFEQKGWFPFNMAGLLKSLGASASDPSSLLGTLSITISFRGTGEYAFTVRKKCNALDVRGVRSQLSVRLPRFNLPK